MSTSQHHLLLITMIYMELKRAKPLVNTVVLMQQAHRELEEIQTLIKEEALRVKPATN